MATRRPRLAVWKFTSCDGCQLSLLDCEEELLPLAGKVEISHFVEASSSVKRGPYDLSLVEGSITTPEQAQLILEVRRESKRLVTIGACATSGGIQALRNFGDVREYAGVTYARPDEIKTLARSTPIAEHVQVDFELRGCPVDKAQVLEVVLAFVHGRSPNVRQTAVCAECKERGTACITVAKGVPCLGPATQSGCGAICPAYDRGCYGCFGPKEAPNIASLMAWWLSQGVKPDAAERSLRSFNAWKPPFRDGLSQ